MSSNNQPFVFCRRHQVKMFVTSPKCSRTSSVRKNILRSIHDLATCQYRQYWRVIRWKGMYTAARLYLIFTQSMFFYHRINFCILHIFGFIQYPIHHPNCTVVFVIIVYIAGIVIFTDNLYMTFLACEISCLLLEKW